MEKAQTHLHEFHLRQGRRSNLHVMVMRHFVEFFYAHHCSASSSGGNNPASRRQQEREKNNRKNDDYFPRTPTSQVVLRDKQNTLKRTSNACNVDCPQHILRTDVYNCKQLYESGLLSRSAKRERPGCAVVGSTTTSIV